MASNIFPGPGHEKDFPVRNDPTLMRHELKTGHIYQFWNSRMWQRFIILAESKEPMKLLLACHFEFNWQWPKIKVVVKGDILLKYISPVVIVFALWCSFINRIFFSHLWAECLAIFNSFPKIELIGAALLQQSLMITQIFGAALQQLQHRYI